MDSLDEQVNNIKIFYKAYTGKIMHSVEAYFLPDIINKIGYDATLKCLREAYLNHNANPNCLMAFFQGACYGKIN